MKNIEIRFNDGKGEFGIHDRFFNAFAIIDGKRFDFQCCCDDDASPTWNDDCAGITWGICGDVNEKLCEHLDNDWEKVIDIIKFAFDAYQKNPMLLYGEESVMYVDGD